MSGSGGAPAGESPVDSRAEGARADGSGAAGATACVTVQSPNGLHLRPSTAFARIASGSGCDVTVRCAGREVNGASVIELAMLAATQGTELEIEVRGPAREAAETLRQLVEVVESSKTT